MDRYVITTSVAKKFVASVKNDKKISAILDKVKKGKATQTDIATYSDLLGKHASDAISTYVDYKNFSEADAKQAIERTLNSDYLRVNNAAALQLKGEDAKKGLKIAIKQEKNFRTKNLLNKLSQATEGAFPTELTEGVKTTSRQFYDDFQQANVKLREELGYKEVVIRTYDDVGLRNRTQPCQFCLDREGEFSFSEAKSLGVFRRHAGCGCHITIETPEVTRDQTNWTNNTWDDR